MNKKVYIKRLRLNKIKLFDCLKKIALFDSREFNLACTRAARYVRNSRNGSALLNV